MANFIINIDHNDINYTNKLSYNLYERCVNEINISEGIQILNLNDITLSLLSTYNGDARKNLVITSIVTNLINVTYLTNVITNIDLPISINITGLNDTTLIPDLLLEGDITIENNPEDNLISSVNITYYIEDENDQKGDTITSSFQFITQPCSSLSSITSSLPIISNGSGVVNYQLTADNQVLYYNISGLPNGITYNINTGLITGTSTLIGVHNIIISVYNEKGVNEVNTTIEIINPIIVPPVITSPLLLTVEEDFIVTYKIEATNNPTSFQYILPPELDFLLRVDPIDPSVLKGKVRSRDTGIYNITITATNDGGIDIETLILDVSIPTDDYLDGFEFEENGGGSNGTDGNTWDNDDSNNKDYWDLRRENDVF